MKSIAILSEFLLNIFISFFWIVFKAKESNYSFINKSLLFQKENIYYLLNFLAFFSFDWITGCLNTNWIDIFFNKKSNKKNCNNLINIFVNYSLLYWEYLYKFCSELQIVINFSINIFLVKLFLAFFPNIKTTL